MDLLLSFSEFLSVLILTVSGVCFTWRLNFFQFHPFKFTKALLQNEEHNIKEIFATFSSSLAGAVGTGNIIGVAAAVHVGGPGVVFWIWVAGFLGMATKYAETYLAASTNNRSCGDPPPFNYIISAFKTKSSGIAFAFFGVISAFTMGNMMQSGAFAKFAARSLNIDLKLISLLIIIIVLPAVSGGVERIKKIFFGVMPIATIIYILIGSITIVMNYDRIPNVLISVFKYAFTPKAIIGGTTLGAVNQCIKAGFSKSLLSNEAGIGSAALAYGTVKTKNPGNSGIWAALDVFMDTNVLSTVTALIILLSPLYGKSDLSVIDAVSCSLGKYGTIGLLICTMVFAVSSIITWGYYGEICFSYISDGKMNKIFRTVFAIVSAIAVFLNVDKIVVVSEISNVGMLIINLFAVWHFRKKIKK